MEPWMYGCFYNINYLYRYSKAGYSFHINSILVESNVFSKSRKDRYGVEAGTLFCYNS